MRPDQCDYPGCELSATGYVSAQWTVEDFMRFEACTLHHEEMLDELTATKVDGQDVVDWESIWYEPQELAAVSEAYDRWLKRGTYP